MKRLFSIQVRDVNNYIKVNASDAIKAININKFYDHSQDIMQSQHLFCLKILEPHLISGAKVLDIGIRTGYMVSCMSYMIQNNHMIGEYKNIGHVFGVDKNSTSVHNARQKLNFFKLEDMTTIYIDNGLYCPPREKFNAIYYNGMFKIDEKVIKNQLVDGGIMISTIRKDSGEIEKYKIITKQKDLFDEKYIKNIYII
jgi:protein-L-isoaspartate O-methyltransferase